MDIAISDGYQSSNDGKKRIPIKGKGRQIKFIQKSNKDGSTLITEVSEDIPVNERKMFTVKSSEECQSLIKGSAPFNGTIKWDAAIDFY